MQRGKGECSWAKDTEGGGVKARQKPQREVGLEKRVERKMG
jgi:hypothetical protein